jgi:hypothetical protein
VAADLERSVLVLEADQRDRRGSTLAPQAAQPGCGVELAVARADRVEHDDFGRAALECRLGRGGTPRYG